MRVLTWSGFITQISDTWLLPYAFHSEIKCHKKTHSSNTSLKTHHACKAHTIPYSNFVSQTWMKTSAIASGVGAPKHRFLTPLRTPLAKSFHHWLELVSQHHSHATGCPSCSGWHGNQAGKKKNIKVHPDVLVLAQGVGYLKNHHLKNFKRKLL